MNVGKQIGFKNTGKGLHLTVFEKTGRTDCNWFCNQPEQFFKSFG